MVLNAIFKAKATAACVPENRLESERQRVRDRERERDSLLKYHLGILFRDAIQATFGTPIKLGTPFRRRVEPLLN